MTNQIKFVDGHIFFVDGQICFNPACCCDTDPPVDCNVCTPETQYYRYILTVPSFSNNGCGRCTDLGGEFELINFTQWHRCAWVYTFADSSCDFGYWGLRIETRGATTYARVALTGVTQDFIQYLIYEAAIGTGNPVGCAIDMDLPKIFQEPTMASKCGSIPESVHIRYVP